MDFSGQCAVILEQGARGRPCGDGETFRDGHIEHGAQFPQIGVFTAHAVGHAGVHFGKRKRYGVDIPAGVLCQLVFDTGADGFHRRGQSRIALFCYVIEAGRHTGAVIAGAPGHLAQLRGIKRAIAALGGVQRGKDAGQIRVGLEQFLEGGIAAGKGRHGFLAVCLWEQTQQAFQIGEGVHDAFLSLQEMIAVLVVSCHVFSGFRPIARGRAPRQPA